MNQGAATGPLQRWARLFGFLIGLLLIGVGLFVFFRSLGDAGAQRERPQEVGNTTLASPGSQGPSRRQPETRAPAAAAQPDPKQNSPGVRRLPEAATGSPQASTPAVTPEAERIMAPWLARHGLGATCEHCGKGASVSERERLLSALALTERGHTHRFGAFKVPLSKLVRSLLSDIPPRPQLAMREEAMSLALLSSLYQVSRDHLLPRRVALALSDPTRIPISSFDTRSAAWHALALHTLDAEVAQRDRRLLATRAASGSSLIEQSLGVLAGLPLSEHPQPTSVLLGLRDRLSQAISGDPVADPEAAFLLLRARLSLSRLTDQEVERTQALYQAVVTSEDGDRCQPPWLNAPGASAIETAAYLQLYLRTVEGALRWRRHGNRSDNTEEGR